MSTDELFQAFRAEGFRFGMHNNTDGAVHVWVDRPVKLHPHPTWHRSYASAATEAEAMLAALELAREEKRRAGIR